MEEPRLVEFPEEKTSGSNRFSFEGEVYTRRVRPDFLKILNQILGIGDFQREKVSLIEGPQNESMDSRNGLDCRNSAGSNLLC
jgi:hypothetical protein